MNELLSMLGVINSVLLSVPVLIVLLIAGVAFTLLSGFSQYRSLTHGFALVSGPCRKRQLRPSASSLA